jgi:hypothetical protein
VKQWNDGKQAEYCRRKPFKVSLEEPGVEAARVMAGEVPCEPAETNAEGPMDPVCTDESLQRLRTV